MTETAFSQFWALVSAALALNAEAFELIQTLPYGTQAALLVVLSAGFSQTLGQGIVLFINRVKPIRFGLSLLIAAMLYAFSYGFWSFSTWLVSYLFLGDYPSFETITRALGLAYAPQLFGFLVALPYLGVPISVLISIWSLLSFLMGLHVALNLSFWNAFWCAGLGWAIFQILQRTIGRPVAGLGRWLADAAAGVPLVTDLKQLEQRVATGLQSAMGQASPSESALHFNSLQGDASQNHGDRLKSGED